MTDSSYSGGDDAARAEILRWQSRYRIGLAAGIAGASALLRTLGIVSSASIGARWAGTGGALGWYLAAAATYAIVVLGSHALLRRRGRASAVHLGALLAADVLVVHVCAMLLTPPGQYDRTLILSVFILQFTQLYFGWWATLFQLSVVAVSYNSIVAMARLLGLLSTPSEQLWTFALFCLGAVAYAWLLGHQGERMKRLTQLFERAREGEFDQPYEEDRDKFPDHITQIGRAYNELRGHLETIVLTDPLSGCFNRRGFAQFASREVSRGVRAKWRISLLALDVDHFKRINDDFGHLTGDEAIKEIGALIRETARAGDVVARTGGEEFSILAPDTDEEGAMHLAERVLLAFRGRSFDSVRGQLTITASIGIASEDAASEDVVSTLLARADEALYASKRQGRDQAVLWRTGMRLFDASGRRSREIERLA